MLQAVVLEDILNKTNNGLYLLDENDNFAYMNKIAEDFLGIQSPGECLGRNIYEIYPIAKQTKEKFNAARSGEFIQFSYPSLTNPDKWIAVKIFPIGGHVAVMFEDRTEQRLIETQLDTEHKILETINDTSYKFIGNLDPQDIIDILTKACVGITGAAFGAYFSITKDETNELVWSLGSLHGAPKEAFTRLGNPRATSVFRPTFTSNEIVRSDDIINDPRYGSMGGMPKGHLPVRSYLAVPLLDRSGSPQGALLFGHPKPNKFNDYTEKTLKGIALQASIAIENASLYVQAQEEIAKRKEIEARQKVLMSELSHRVKNILATVQSIAGSTLRNSSSLDEFWKGFNERILGIARTNDLLTKTNWTSATLHETVQMEIAPFGAERFQISGPSITYGSKTVLALAMAFHELITNAVKYGALSNSTGHISITWHEENDRIILVWRETGGPVVVEPTRKGFGTKLIRAILSPMNGKVEMDFASSGLVVRMELARRCDEDSL